MKTIAVLPALLLLTGTFLAACTTSPESQGAACKAQLECPSGSPDASGKCPSGEQAKPAEGTAGAFKCE